MKPVALTAEQFAALALVKSHGEHLDHDLAMIAALAPQLREPLTQALLLIKKAHESFLAETQRAVSLAAPGDIAAAVNGLVRP